MRQFFRTGAGKTILYFTCVLSALALLLSVAGMAGMLSYSDLIYGSQTREVLRDRLYVRRMEGIAWRGIMAYYYPDEYEWYYYTNDDNYSNAVYQLVNSEGEVFFRNEDIPDTSSWEYVLTFLLSRPEQGVGDLTYLGCNLDQSEIDQMMIQGNEQAELCTARFHILEGMPRMDYFRLMDMAAKLIFRFRYSVFVIAVIAFVLTLVSFIALMFASGRRPDTEEVFPGPLYAVPFDLMTAAVIAVPVITFFIAEDTHNFWAFVVLAVGAVITVCTGLGVCMSCAARIKKKTLLSGMITVKIIKLVLRLIRAVMRRCMMIIRFFLRGLAAIRTEWKMAAVYLLFCIAEGGILLSIDSTGDQAAFYFIERALLLPAVTMIAVFFGRLLKGGKALAEGDLSSYIDTRGMFWDIKRHAENLNSAADGISLAVEGRLKSERMKTELITNVSHDIKTPLTSIINYASLIGEETDREKIDEYSKVLVRQSDRLKRLLEDLVEASKASTGNLEVDLMPCDASVFLEQASGEYEEKLSASQLALVTSGQDSSIRIMADGRRMWRIFDNLMNNICKYAMPGTRVYLSLEEKDGNAVFTFKNTSRDPLNISEEELMERFTRGDSSRNTEGNGLGLAIARSMAELQNGTLDLSIDGDLFKAILSFPAINA